MVSKLSGRLQDMLNLLPLEADMRVLEVGCGPGALARAMAFRIGAGYVLGIDRSPTAISQARSGGKAETGADLDYICERIEAFSLPQGMQPFDLCVAVRVGALDGRHPKLAVVAFAAIWRALKPDGRLFIDGVEHFRM